MVYSGSLDLHIDELSSLLRPTTQSSFDLGVCGNLDLRLNAFSFMSDSTVHGSTLSDTLRRLDILHGYFTNRVSHLPVQNKVGVIDPPLNFATLPRPQSAPAVGVYSDSVTSDLERDRLMKSEDGHTNIRRAPVVTSHTDVSSHAELNKHHPQIYTVYDSTRVVEGMLNVQHEDAYFGNCNPSLSRSFFQYTGVDVAKLHAVLHLPISEAAVRLHMGKTTLKARCRMLGITRWPGRKLRSLDNALRTAQAVGMSVDSECVRNVLKTKRMIELSPGVRLTENTKKLQSNLSKKRYRIKRDERNHLKRDERND